MLVSPHSGTELGDRAPPKVRPQARHELLIEAVAARRAGGAHAGAICEDRDPTGLLGVRIRHVPCSG